MFWSNVVQLGRRRQVAVDQQVGDLQEAGVLGELLDRVAAVAQDARVAVDVGDGRRGGRGVHEAGVKGDGAGLLQQLGNVVAFVSFDNLDAREFELAAGIAQGCAGVSQSWSPLHEASGPLSKAGPTSGEPAAEPVRTGFQRRAAFLWKATIDSQLKTTGTCGWH